MPTPGPRAAGPAAARPEADGGACEHVRDDPRPRWTDPRVAAGYAARCDALDRRLAWPELIGEVRPREPCRALGRPDGTVLDFGSGLGLFSHDLVGEHWVRAVAVDLSPALHRLGARVARDAWLTRTVPDRFGRLPTRTAQCTAAVAHLVFTHLEHACLVAAALGEIRRSLRRGAPLAFTEPGTYGVGFPGLRWGEPGREPGEDEPFTAYYGEASGAGGRMSVGMVGMAARRYSTRQLAGCLKDSGFQIREIRPLAGGPGQDAPFVLWRAEAV
jgi:SAM-dependent methyltransferase